MKIINYLRLTVPLCLVVVMVGLSLAPIGKAAALTGANFSPGHIIDDAVFANNSAMSATDVQNFLNAQVPTCDTAGTQLSTHSNGSGGFYTHAQWGAVYDSTNNTTIAAAPYVCLKNYIENPTTGQNNLQNPTASIAGGESAAQIIYNAAQAYAINPEVILTTLQKEQGLVTDNWPWTDEYTEAMGYNCPDSGGCSGFTGFYQQVNAAAKQYRNYMNNPNNFNYVVGSDTVAYSPSCAGPTITIQNQATAALYDYTPYQPDPTVLAATNSTGSSSGPGSSVPSSDNCGTDTQGQPKLRAAYGNRNFWWYFNTWFGSSLYEGVPYTHPSGTLVRDQNSPQVYLIENGQRLPVTTASTLFSYGYNFGQVRFANYYDDQLPVGSPLPYLKQGTLFKGSGPAIYVFMLNGTTPSKELFPTWTIFTGLGYTLNDVMTVPDAEIPTADYPQQVSLTNHPVGALVQQQGTPQVYQIQTDGGKSLFPNAETFLSYGYSFTQLKPATTADMALPNDPAMGYKEGALVQGSGPQISVIVNQTGGTQAKAFISSWFCFQQFGYVYPSDVLHIADWENAALPTYGPAC